MDNTNISDQDWISRRWQGEGEVKAPESPKHIDVEKQQRLAAMRDTTDLDGNAGRQCQHLTCGKFDYLPAHCAGCNKYFCQDHADFEAHGCDSTAVLGDKRATTCLLCNHPIHVDSKTGESVDTAMSRHIDSGCKSGLAEKVRKQRNAMNRCQHKLPGKKACKECPLVRFQCNDCEKSFCLKHRHPLDHKCPGAHAKPQTAMSLGGPRAISCRA